MPSARKATVAAPECARSKPAIEAREKLDAYEALIRRWNRRVGLVASGDLARLRERHIDDSLALLPWVAGRLADVGAGAGLPGVPLAIARPQTPVVLIERSTRKCEFLRQVVIDLALANVEVVAEDVRAVRSGKPFDTVTIRAVAPPAEAWKLARGLLVSGGTVLLQSNARLAVPFDGGAVVDEAAAGRGFVTVVSNAP